MDAIPQDPIGAAWLAKAYQVPVLSSLFVLSQIGGRRETQRQDGTSIETYVESMRPRDEAAAHLQFHLRHEIPSLAFLARLFARSGPDFILSWVLTEPTGQYARRAAFLYEWLTGEELTIPAGVVGGNYVNAVDDRKLVTATSAHAEKIKRWRINNNLPGTRYFCPVLVKGEALETAMQLDVSELFHQLTEEFGEDLLLRAAAWMTLRESKASFAIEGEGENEGRVQRFADVMARRTGQDNIPLTDDELASLQTEILGTRTSLTHFGIRQSPVFVGETQYYQELVHYIAPPPDQLDKMLHGLRVFLEKTQGQSAVMRSAVVAFGFVYIHPLADGNGRVHRFLVNDVLRRDKVLLEPTILPISAVIGGSVFDQQAYSEVLDSVSRPLMDAVHQAMDDTSLFASTYTTYPDGVTSNLAFQSHEHCLGLWRYPNLSSHVVFLADVIQRTINEHMREQSRYLRSHTQARLAIKEVIEMPDQQIDRVIRSIEQNNGVLSNVLAKEVPLFQQHPAVWAQVVASVRQAFSENGIGGQDILQRYHPTRPANI